MSEDKGKIYFSDVWDWPGKTLSAVWDMASAERAIERGARSAMEVYPDQGIGCSSPLSDSRLAGVMVGSGAGLAFGLMTDLRFCIPESVAGALAGYCIASWLCYAYHKSLENKLKDQQPPAPQ